MADDFEVVTPRGGGKPAPKPAQATQQVAPPAKPASTPAAPRPAPTAAPKAAPKPKAPNVETVGNPMRQLRVAKVTVNIGVGQAGDRLEKAERVLAALSGAKPVRTIARKAIRDWNIREGMPIGVKVTLRGDPAIDFAKRALWTRNFRVANWSFDREGNLQFGIPDHTAFEGQKYNPEVGIFGMDVSVTVERPGFRIKHRHREQKRVSRRHRITSEESQTYLGKLLGLEIV